MKNSRHSAVLEIIENNIICTQEDLGQALLQRGFDVTQATVSRDIKDLRLLKVHDENGNYRYTVSKTKDFKFAIKYKDILANAVINIQYAMNDVVVKCYTGMAQAACAAIDSMNFEMIVGTLAGDDTIIIITKGEKQASMLVNEIYSIIR